MAKKYVSTDKIPTEEQTSPQPESRRGRRPRGRPRLRHTSTMQISDDSSGEEQQKVEDCRQEEEKLGNDDVPADADVVVGPSTGSSHRRVSIVEASSIIIKEGYMMKQTRFGRWIKRYCTVDNGKLFLRKSETDKLREEVILKDASLSEKGVQNANHAFTIIAPHNRLTLAAADRKELEEWMSAIKQASLNLPSLELAQHLDGQHSWFNCSHPRPTYCNVCGDALNGMAWHGLSCEVCKFKCHRSCVFYASQPCKWTTTAHIENTKESAALQNLSISHQWIEGNLPVGSKCMMCTKACGSVKRLQDFRCLWCKQAIHRECKRHAIQPCTLGALAAFVLPPSAVKQSNEIVQGMWEPYKLCSSSNPVLAFVNSKSGDNRGVRFIRRLKFWLNPIQVFDLAICGPETGLQLFQRLDQFRVLVFGGDGSVGWVLSAIDKLHLQSKCILGVVPLGTGNDLARVLGWGSQFHDEEKLPSLFTEIENSRVQLLDRWSIGFTKDADFNIDALLRRGHSRSNSNTSIDTRMFNGSMSPQSGHPQSSLTTDQSATVSKPQSNRSSISPIPPPTQLCIPTILCDSASINSSVSSCGDCPAILSQSPSSFQTNSSDLSDCDLSTEMVIDKENSNGGKPVARHAKSSSLDNDEYDHNVDVLVTPPQDTSPTKAVKWAEPVQELIASHLSTILLTDNDEQVLISSKVLSDLVKEYVSSLQSKEFQKLIRSGQYEQGPLKDKCSILNEKMASLMETLNQEIGTTTPSKKCAETKTSEEKTAEEKTAEKKKLKVFQPRQAVMARANSLKKAVESVFDITEKALNVQEPTIAESKRGRKKCIDSGDRQLDDDICPSVTISPELDDDTVPSPEPLSSLTKSLLSTENALGVPTLPHDFHEQSSMNNYFGLGIDAHITLQFHTRRQENPDQCRYRTYNMVMYGYYGSKEFFTNSQRNLERKLRLECDGKAVELPNGLQGLVFLNITSYMAGTNFWGTGKKVGDFSAPSVDDRMIEVAGITGFSHLAKTKIFNIQNQRIAQCRSAKVTVLSKIPMQVDGEAGDQLPGTVTITHKNKARFMVKDKTFSQSLESWSAMHSLAVPIDSENTLPVAALLHDVLTTNEISVYRNVARAARSLMECIQLESGFNLDVTLDLIPYVISVKMCLDRVFSSSLVMSETADLEHLQDMESSIRSLIQETLWFLDMDKIWPDRENEMRSLVICIEGKIKDTILAQHSTKTVAQRKSQEVPSDSILILHRSPKSTRERLAGRDRSTPVVETKTISNSQRAITSIGKDVKDWDCKNVCFWLKAIELDQYVPIFVTEEITGRKLMDMKTADLQELGITQTSHIRRVIQCLRIFKQQAKGDGDMALEN